MPSRRRAQPAPEGPSKAWLDSYADAMTLLLAFFVLLFAMSNLDVRKYEAFFEGLNGPQESAATGTLEGTTAEFIPPPAPSPLTVVNEDDTPAENTEMETVSAVEPVDQSDVDAAAVEEADDVDPCSSGDGSSVSLEDELFRVTRAAAEALVEELDAALASQLDQSEYSVDLEQRGVVVRLADNALFDSGAAALDDDARDVLAVVAGVLTNQQDNDIEVEGHTDNRPTNAATFPTNWELSTARATNVLRELLENPDLDASRFAAVGRADTIPRGDNATDAGRAENRRTEIVVLFPEMLPSTC